MVVYAIVTLVHFILWTVVLEFYGPLKYVKHGLLRFLAFVSGC